MIQGHRDTQPVPFREAHALAGEIAVVENIAMGERGTLGRAGSAAGELDIDGVIGFEHAFQLFQLQLKVHLLR